MAIIHYTAEVKSGRLLELPTEAEELHLMPGDRVQVQLEHEPGATSKTVTDQDINNMLQQWRQHDDVTLFPDVPTQTLMARWAQEDALMTDAEREAETRLWQDVEKSINETRIALGMRTL